MNTTELLKFGEDPEIIRTKPKNFRMVNKASVNKFGHIAWRIAETKPEKGILVGKSEFFNAINNTGEQLITMEDTESDNIIPNPLFTS